MKIKEIIDIRGTSKKKHTCPDCEEFIDGDWRTGVCDDCGGNGRDENDESCSNCQGTGSPICCRCEGTGIESLDMMESIDGTDQSGYRIPRVHREEVDLSNKTLNRIRRIRKQVRNELWDSSLGATDLGMCDAVSERLQQIFDWDIIKGFYIQNGKKIEHYWNIMKDGTIVDGTHDQFGNPDIVIATCKDNIYKRYTNGKIFNPFTMFENNTDQQRYRIPRAHREEVGCSECGRMEGLEPCGTFKEVSDPICPTCRKRWDYRPCERCGINHIKGICPQVGAMARWEQ